MGYRPQTQVVEEDNERLEEALTGKVKALKSVRLLNNIIHSELLEFSGLMDMTSDFQIRATKYLQLVF